MSRHHSSSRHTDEQDGWTSEGASDMDIYDEDDVDSVHDYHHGKDSSQTVKRVVRNTRWHRKVVVAILLVVLVLGVAIHQGKAQPYLTTITNDVHSLTAWVRSKVGVSFLYTLAALIALDIAVDVVFGAWNQRRF